MAAEVGHLGLAFDYLEEAALMDLRDLEHNTRDGLHLASLAGSWIALVAGFGGMRDHDGHICFSPRLPEEISGLAFCLALRGGRLRVEVTAGSASYDRLEGDPLELAHHGDWFTVSPGAPIVRAIPQSAPRPRTAQPPGREVGGICGPGP